MSRAVQRWEARLNEALRRTSMTLLGDDGQPAPLARLATGSPLDGLLGGGLPRGRLVELYGPPGGGKTQLALTLAAGVQRAGGTAAFIDVDGSLDPGRARALGVNLATLVAARPSGGEEALQLVDAVLRARAAELVIVDSVAALVPREELLAPLGEAPAGLHARLMSQALRRMVAHAAAARAVVLFLNQQRTTFDEEGRAFLTTTGGHALHFHAATRLAVRTDAGIDARSDARPDARPDAWPDAWRVRGALVVQVAKDRFGAEGRTITLDPRPALSPS